MWLAAIGAVLVTPIPPFLAYYLKVGPKFSTGQIMMFEVLRYSGVMVAAWLIRRRIDRTGARPFFFLALGLYALVGVYWWFFLQTGLGGLAGILAAYFALGLGAASWAIANLNYLPQIVTAEERTLTVSIHGAVTACLGGISPILWGVFLKSGDGAGAALMSSCSHGFLGRWWWVRPFCFR